MAFEQHIPFLSIFLSIVSSFLIGLFRNSTFARVVNSLILLTIMAMSVILIRYFIISGTDSFVYNLGHYPAPWANTLSSSLVEAILALVFSTVMFLSLWGGADEVKSDIIPRKQYLYYLFLALLFSSLLVLTYTNDIFTAYVFLEINTLAACAIIVIKENGETLRATLKYFVMSAVGSGLFLFTIAMLYGITGHLAMDSLYESIQLLHASGEYYVPLLLSFVFFFVALAIKSALYPFHNWLPDAHSSATPASSALLSGLVLKGYIILFIKVIVRMYGFDVVRDLKVFPVIFGVGILSMIVGSILALFQRDIKKMIAYSSVAQMGYIYAAIGIGTPIGVIAAIFHIIAHAITKPALFLSAGKMMHETGIRDVRFYNGFGKLMPIAMGIFTVAGLSMIGIPPSIGFSSKWNLALASFDQGQYLMLIFITISTLLNIAYYMPIIVRAFFNQSAEDVTLHSGKSISTTYIPQLILAALIILLGLFSGNVIELLQVGLASW